MKILLLLLALVPLNFRPGYTEFKNGQLKYERVKIAYAEKLPMIKKLLESKNLDINKLQLYIRAFKHEKVVEVWGSNSSGQPFQLVQEIKFCATSGRLGPKNQRGDGQIPEGFYYVNRFHPESRFFLSLGLNYPNAADSARNDTFNLGGDIFVHGKCASIGCISITDEHIKELYILAIEASGNGQDRIPVHIFPARLTNANLAHLALRFANRPELFDFWETLLPAYNYFEKEKQVPTVIVRKNGDYALQQ